MKVLKVINLSIVAVVVAMVILPFAMISGSFEPKPVIDPLGVGAKMNSWLEANMDLRKSISRWLKFRITHISPSESLHLGKKGWMFYTPDHSLEIARGTYPLEQSVLDEYTVTMSNVKRYYELMGADFYFMSYPAKTSIYPEYIFGENLTVGKSPTDIVIDNLRSRTDVNTISPKSALIEAKANNKTYQKTDDHANDYGAYITYKTICGEIAQKSNLDMRPVNVQFVDGEYLTGANALVKVEGLFGKSETGPVAVYDAKAYQVIEGELFDAIEGVMHEKYADLVSNSIIFENPDATNGTLLIYGTSMFLYDNIGESHQLTRYLAENFKYVVYIGITFSIFPEVDLIVKPDIVIAECPERYSNGWERAIIQFMPQLKNGG